MQFDMESLLSVVDHLVYIAPSLEQGMDRIEQLLGVRAAIGGRHAIWRTRNALLSLGPRTYLEIMAPDEAALDQSIVRPFGLETLKEPRLETWAVRSTGLEDNVAVARQHGLDLGEIQSGSRQKPDGTILQWKLTDLRTSREDGAVPFLIDWGSSPHPAGSAPQGCLLRSLRVFHPDAKRVELILKEIGILIEVETGLPAVEATIETKSGEIVLR